MYRRDNAETRAKIDRHFRIAQQDFRRYLDQHAQFEDPNRETTGLEWMANSATCSALADTYEIAAQLWDRIQPDPPEYSIALAYRATARRYQDEAARAELYAALASVAPDGR